MSSACTLASMTSTLMCTCKRSVHTLVTLYTTCNRTAAKEQEQLQLPTGPKEQLHSLANRTAVTNDVDMIVLATVLLGNVGPS